MAYTYTPTLGVFYGTDPLQFVNYYVTDKAVPLGVIIWIHAGGWRSSNTGIWGGFSSSVENATHAAYAEAGYTFLAVNYRGTNSDGGSSGNGQYPNSINDVKQFLENIGNPAGAPVSSPAWQNTQDYINNNGGWIIVGNSAGGHIAIMAACNHGVATNYSNYSWPKAVICLASPMNLNYNDGYTYMEPSLGLDYKGIRYYVEQYVTSTADLNAASPHYNFYTLPSGPPGSWFSPLINNSNSKFYFIQNDNDTLVPNHVNLPFIETLRNTLGVSRVFVDKVGLGPPQGDFYVTNQLVYKGAIASTASLPSSGQIPGDTYSILDAPSGFVSYWVYTGANYTSPGGDANSTINGFAFWFNHNYELLSSNTYIRSVTSELFSNVNITPGSETYTPKVDGYIPLPEGTVSSVYSQSLSTSGGTSPYTYSTFLGELPPGLTISSSGTISGTPTRPGYYRWVVQSVDTHGANALKRYLIVVNKAAPISGYSIQSLVVGDGEYAGANTPKKYWRNLNTPFKGVWATPGSAYTHGVMINSPGSHVLALDEPHWVTDKIDKPTGSNLTAILDYWRWVNVTPGIVITPASEIINGVPFSTVLSTALLADFVALDPYLITPFIAPYNSGSSTINSSTVKNTINGLIEWTLKWIKSVTDQGKEVVLVTQNIVEPALSSYVGEYLNAQYKAFTGSRIKQRVIFLNNTLVGTAEGYGTFQSFGDIWPFYLRYQLTDGGTNLHQTLPKFITGVPDVSRPASGFVYPRTTIKYGS